MQFRYALTTFLVALCCADTVVGRHISQRRQGTGDGKSVSPASTDGTATSTNASPTTSATPDGSKTKATKNESQKTTAVTSSTTKHGVAAAAVTTSHLKATADPGNKNGKQDSENEKLPLRPKITPAVGIAGVILLGTGVAYCLIGIKHQWLLVFLSSAYLASLSVTVLVLYVMSPPVSDAIQGAYFVAVCATGLIFGAISLVFKEMTEGLGCLLGGFCISMWFLVLRPGGLIESTTGRAVMIGVFCAVGWSLSFSKYTRNYGLILCTAFAGAMITMIGIDCFSRAGLKEFWIYIWALNNNEFPIHTTTYPITRGIRVEIAGTIVLFLFGVMSQIKIWKIVRDRKSKKEEAKHRESMRREQRDSAIGKRVETINERSLAQWEAVYGDRNAPQVPADSGVGTSINTDPKKSASVAEREIESIEMDDMHNHANGRTSKASREPFLVRIASEEETPQQGPALNVDFDAGDYSWWADFKSQKAKSNIDSRPSLDLEQHPPVPPIPSIVPTPAEDSTNAPSEGGSDASKAATDKSVHERRGVALNKLALQKLNERAPPALPRIEDDRASSVAATANDDPDIDVLSTKRLSVAPSMKDGLSPFSDKFRTADRDMSGSRTPQTPGTPGESPLLENEDDEELVRPKTAKRESTSDDKPKDKRKSRRKSSNGSLQRDTGSVGELEDEEADDLASIHSLKGHLPESMSKVAMAYRTNEWAKHIADADQPADDDAVTPEVEDEPGVQVEVGRPKDTARKVDPEALLETGAVDGTSPQMSSNPFRQSKDVKAPKRPSSSSGATPVYAHRSASHQSLQRQSSNTSLQQKKDTRNSSAPLPQQGLVELPIEEEPTGSERFETPMGSTINLLDDRNHRLNKRITTTNFNALNIPTPASDSKEDLTLTERKALLDQGVIQPASPPKERRRPPSAPQPNPALGRMNSTSNQNLIYDSHQPKRSNTVDAKQRNAMLTQWRSSLQQEATSTPNAVAEEQARMAMIDQRRRASYKRSKEQQERETRESMRDIAARTGQLTNAHQDAMRRMQAKAYANTGA